MLSVIDEEDTHYFSIEVIELEVGGWDSAVNI